MRWMNRLATAVIVLGVVAGPPVLFAVWLLHDPWQPPTRVQLQAWAEQPVTAGTIIAACAAVAGLAWLLFLIHLTRRALAGLRRQLYRVRHLAVPTPAQMTASSMAGIAAFTLPAAATGHPQPPPSTAGTPQLLDPAGSDHHGARSAQTQPPGITLPGGGWIPYRTAGAITALVAAVWLQRRRSYRPDPGQPRDHHDDPDLQPLTDTIRTITAAVTDDTTTGLDRTPPPPALAQQLPEGVLLLTGPGAAAAARGLMVEAALSGTPAVVVQAGDLGALMPPGDPANPTIAQHTAEADERAAARTAIVLSDEPGAATHRWYVTPDGAATGSGLTEPRRLCTLDPQTAADLLALIRRAHQPPPSASPHSRTAPSQPAAPQPAAATAARLTLLGGCRLGVGGESVHLRRAAGLQILAYLAIHPHGATRTELTHAIWPHLPPATISQRLHTTLADLRRQLRPVLGEDPVARHDDRYRLNSHAISTDLHRWRTATHAMAHAVGATDRDNACRTVIDLYRGDLAAEHGWQWLTPVREQTRRTVVDAYATLAGNADPGEALTLLQRAIGIDPHNEALHHQAAGLLHAAGDHAGAADLIKRLHQRVAEETHPPC